MKYCEHMQYLNIVNNVGTLYFHITRLRFYEMSQKKFWNIRR